jgi:DNA repair exonuclease SbcCD ATPase subunit
LQSNVNNNLSEILNGKMLKFDFVKAKKDRLEISIVDYENDRTRIYEGWSGGEKGKMNLCSYISLNKLANIRSGKKIEFLVIDEKLSDVDIESMNKIFTMLKREYAGKKVFVISHIPGIEQNFNQVVTIKKSKGISYIDSIENNKGD